VARKHPELGQDIEKLTNSPAKFRRFLFSKRNPGIKHDWLLSPRLETPRKSKLDLDEFVFRLMAAVDDAAGNSNASHWLTTPLKFVSSQIEGAKEKTEFAKRLLNSMGRPISAENLSVIGVPNPKATAEAFKVGSGSELPDKVLKEVRNAAARGYITKKIFPFLLAAGFGERVTNSIMKKAEEQFSDEMYLDPSTPAWHHRASSLVPDLEYYLIDPSLIEKFESTTTDDRSWLQNITSDQQYQQLRKKLQDSCPNEMRDLKEFAVEGRISTTDKKWHLRRQVELPRIIERMQKKDPQNLTAFQNRLVDLIYNDSKTLEQLSQ
jgi:hypothetical protein